MCVICPLGNLIFSFLIAVLNVESLQLLGNSLPVHLGIMLDSAGDIGTERGLFPLVHTNVTIFFATWSLRRLAAHPIDNLYLNKSWS